MPNSQPICRSCGNPDLDLIIDFGYTPLADRLLTTDQLEQPEYTALLDFLAENKGWVIKEHFTNNNGLTVIERVV